MVRQSIIMKRLRLQQRRTSKDFKMIFKNFQMRSARSQSTDKDILLTDVYHDFIKRNRIISVQCLALKRKYASVYFNDKSYSTLLMYRCLLIDETYRSGRNIYDIRVLSHYKAALLAFKDALCVITKQDKQLQNELRKHQNIIKIFLNKLGDLIDMIPESKCNVNRRFCQRSIKEETIKHFQSNLLPEECIRNVSESKRDLLLKEYTGFVILQQLHTLVCRFQTILGDLKDYVGNC